MSTLHIAPSYSKSDAVVVPKTVAPLSWLETPVKGGVPPRLWEEAFVGPLRHFLNRPGKSFRAKLVEVTWRLVSPSKDLPDELPLIIEWIHAGSLIVDDIQDGSCHRRGQATLHERYGVPLALNTGNALYFLPLSLLERLHLPPELEVALHRRINRAFLQCHRGQALDLKAHILSLSQEEVPGVVGVISELKTASLMELAVTLGPAAAAAEAEEVEAFAHFGQQAGIALQMLNDLSDLTGTGDPHKQFEDLCQGRATWPWAWAAKRLSPSKYADLLELAATVFRHDVSPSLLADALLEAAAQTGRSEIHELLEQSLATLQGRLGNHRDLEPIRKELERLERSYG